VGDQKARIPITPATRVAELLDAWPELEEVLVAQAPAFRRLRNPVLRRTVARVATLEQAAGVGGLAVRDLVATLRVAAGLEAGSPAVTTRADASVQSDAVPPWLDPSRVVAVLDADALLDAGQVPLGAVNEQAGRLAPGDLLRLESSFRPVPLLDALATQGYGCFVRQAPDGRFETFVVGRG
jgi:hypothetical protein